MADEYNNGWGGYGDSGYNNDNGYGYNGYNNGNFLDPDAGASTDGMQVEAPAIDGDENATTDAPAEETAGDGNTDAPAEETEGNGDADAPVETTDEATGDGGAVQPELDADFSGTEAKASDADSEAKPKAKKPSGPTLAEIRKIIAAYKTVSDERLRGFLSNYLGKDEDAQIVAAYMGDTGLKKAVADAKSLKAESDPAALGIKVMSMAMKERNRVRAVWKVLAAVDPEAAGNVGDGKGNDIDVSLDVSKLLPVIDLSVLDQID